ncbi:hypothetical protein [Candidatus Binatus sp.]|jgi:hypothetical protein|uniref:hypothetical protein n=1 Tax=Candidatus Binatus sp. TaxID=2811406 RepID=UPI003C554547
MADSKFRESLRDFLTQYPLWTVVDQFLDSKWGKRFLALLGGAVLTGIGWIASLFTALSSGLKYGLFGAFGASLFAALVIYLTKEKEMTITANTNIHRTITPEQRQLFAAMVKRLSLQDKSVHIKGSKHDGEMQDYWHTLVELFRANGMVTGGQIEDSPSYDPRGLVLVVQEPQVDRLIGHAKTIFELLRSAQIPFELGYDGRPRQQEGWCYLYVGRRS